MKNLLSLLLTAVFATSAFAAAHTGAPMPEAQKQGSEKAQAAAEAKHLAKPHGTDKTAAQPEAMKTGSDKAQARAEAKKAKKAKTAKKSSTDDQMAKDAKKL